MTEFPDSCLRGLHKKDYLTVRGVSAAAFEPDPRTAADREDGGQETSINWEDDETVQELTLSQRDARGNICYPHGIARLPRAWIDRVNELPGSESTLTYERRPTLADPDRPDNPYHGNLVFRADLPTRAVRMIAGALALAATPLSPAP